MTNTAPKPFVFVLMPFSRDFDDIYHVSSRVIFPVRSRLKLPLNELGYLLEASPRQQRQKLTATLPAAGPGCTVIYAESGKTRFCQ